MMRLVADQIWWAVSERRRAWSLRSLVLATTSHKAISNVMPKLHDASHQTIMLRSGLALGIIKPMGNA